MRVQVLVDTPNSWIIPYAEKLVKSLSDLGHESYLINKHSEVNYGDILCLLGCEKIFKALYKNRHNLVVHESDLPKGKGWSPLTWQILDGKNKIPITLFEAAEGVDSGSIYVKDIIHLKGDELNDEIKHKQGKATIDLILRFINGYGSIDGKTQQGKESFYPRRTPNDSKLDVNKSIAEQFNLLRVCDNERYPAWFVIDGKKYILKIYRDGKN
jgi:methionyl-tRNA formyltransferase